MFRDPEVIARELRSVRNALANLVSRSSAATPPGDRPSPDAVAGMRARYDELEAELATAVRVTGGAR